MNIPTLAVSPNLVTFDPYDYPRPANTDYLGEASETLCGQLQAVQTLVQEDSWLEAPDRDLLLRLIEPLLKTHCKDSTGFIAHARELHRLAFLIFRDFNDYASRKWMRGLLICDLTAETYLMENGKAEAARMIYGYAEEEAAWQVA